MPCLATKNEHCFSLPQLQSPLCLASKERREKNKRESFSPKWERNSPSRIGIGMIAKPNRGLGEVTAAGWLVTAST